jgi:hypothetical protein
MMDTTNARMRAANAYEGATELLENRVFPAIVKYSTHPAHISALIVLWMCLLLFGGWAVFALTGGNYFNGLCGIVSCILLGKQMQHHHATTKALHDAHTASRESHASHAAELKALKSQNHVLATYLHEMNLEVAELRKAVEAKPARKAPVKRSRGKSQFDPMDPIEED